ncbi:MAG TPA: asparagine synthase-related protein [Gemmatimonadaceae bacterium]
MSAVLGVFGERVPPRVTESATRMLAAMAHRGRDRSIVHRVDGAVMGVARQAWELDPGFAGPVLVARQDELTVAADATLYYRRDLARALRARGEYAGDDTSSALILAAYRAWGVECAEHLEGDFAFVLWDARRHLALAARDFGGKRPLFHACAGDAWLVASTISGVLACPAVSRELDATVIAEEMAALTGSADETAWRAVRRVAPGSTVTWRGGAAPASATHWRPPAFADTVTGGTGSLDDAAGELRLVLREAVSERLAPRGRTAICLSGGWDSPAVFATASQLLREHSGRRSVHALSVSFPPGDPGNEDELIGAIVRYWRTDAHWLRADEIPALDGMEERATRRDEPFPHPFEAMNRALARAGVAMGARVVLDGNGGDQLFQVSDVYLADLLAGGRWRTLAREWRARGGGVGVRDFARDVVAPALPDWLLRAVDAVRGGAPLAGGGLERRPPRWVRADFARRVGLAERERAHLPPRGRLSRAARESACQLARPTLGRMTADVSAFALEAGAEHRSPLHDARVVRFAASRPVLERRSGVETKRLLRRAMAGLLPADVLAPRRVRTGVPIGYFLRAVRAHAPRLVETLFRAPVLGELGIIEPDAMRAAWDDVLRRGSASGTVALYLALETELWLRAHRDGADVGRSDEAREDLSDHRARAVLAT